MKKDNALHPAIRILILLFTFLLLMEWLKPIEIITDTSDVYYFSIFAALSLMVYAFNLSKKAIVPILLCYIFFTEYMLFYRADYFMSQDSWLMAFVMDIKDGVTQTVTGELTGLTSSYRTFLFYLFIWMLTFLIYYWVTIKQKLFFFLFMTFIYIAVLDTFTPYDGDSAIVRLVIMGFVVLGILTILRLFLYEKVIYSTRKVMKWGMPLAGMIAFAVILGFSAPKPQAVWPDPVAFIKSQSEKYGAGKNTLGYDENDSKLGGDYIGNDQVVFRAQSSLRHYWKVENKDIYTGKGWESAPDFSEQFDFSLGERAPVSDYFGDIHLTSSDTTLEIVKDNGHIPYPAPMGIEAINNLSKKERDRISKFVYTVNSSKIEAYNIEELAHLKKIQINYQHPTYNLDLLKKDTMDEVSYEGRGLDRYLYLPDTLPTRVQDLAWKIIVDAEANSTYDKVKAIEKYLKSGKFTYSKEGVPYPAENQDYVDQFLFETNIGYCDNFSSSMVVMVRSLGIPARWAKGYTAGKELSEEKEGQYVYEITNNNAHSWPEVYFPSVGWVPFEPTKTFTEETRFTSSIKVADPSENNTATTVKKPEKKKDEIKKEKPEEKSTNAGDPDFNWNKAAVSMMVLLAVSILIFRMRGKWLPYFWVIYYRKNHASSQMAKAYLQLLKEMNRYGIKRKQNQTLREYAIYIDRFFNSTDMQKLTSEYERYCYAGQIEEIDWKRFRIYWERMMLKTIA